MGRRGTSAGRRGEGDVGSRGMDADGSVWRERLRVGVEVFSATTTVVVCVGLVMFAVLGRGWLRDRAALMKQGESSVVINWPAASGGGKDKNGEALTWMDRRSREAFTALATAQLDLNPLEPGAMDRVYAALMETGWFSSLRVRREGAERVAVDAEWRLPAARVKTADGGGGGIVSTDGRLLSGPDMWGLPVISGVRHPAPEKAGEVWIGGEVTAGLGLIEVARSQVWWKQIAAVEVLMKGARVEMTLITDRGNQIVWGGVVGEFNAGEATDEQKLRRLAQIQRTYGRVDGDTPRIDIRLQAAPMIDRALGMKPEP